VVENLPKGVDTGIYYGFASVDNGEVHKMVMSIGWNPYYENEHKSMVSQCEVEKVVVALL
jgi:riboflavin kinase